MANYAVIMAGGVGSRFWPLSRSFKPKQFLDILGVGRTLLQQTYDRLKHIFDDENIYIVTSHEYTDIVKEQLPSIPQENILAEPARRNTAPCIAYAAYKLIKKDPKATMIVSPADHLITDENKFIDYIKKGLKYASENDVLLTIGLKPTRPETGYGYIQFDSNDTGDIRKVKTFTEKPDYEIAKVFIESGEFLWNSGIFIWKAEVIIKEIAKYLPDISEMFEKYADRFNTPSEVEAVKKIYESVRSISIDYGVMENASDVYVIIGDFGWSDLGTWRALYEAKPKDENNNVVVGENVLLYETKNSIINITNQKLVVVQGLENIIVAEDDGMILITTFKDEQKVRQIVNDIKLEKGAEYV